MNALAELSARLRQSPGVLSKLSVQSLSNAFGTELHSAWINPGSSLIDHARATDVGKFIEGVGTFFRGDDGVAVHFQRAAHQLAQIFFVLDEQDGVWAA